MREGENKGVKVLTSTWCDSERIAAPILNGIKHLEVILVNEGCRAWRAAYTT